MVTSQFAPEYIEKLDSCPWCGADAKNSSLWCEDQQPFKTVQCIDCGMVFVKQRLNNIGRREYYKRYYTDVHKSQDALNEIRCEMYHIDYKFIESHIDSGRILDVGCAGGEFLTYFNTHDWERWGIEFGEEALRNAQQMIGDHMFCGELPALEGVLSNQRFDLIAFRGVIEHVANPKDYIKTAIRLLSPKGKIFIGSVPNRDSLCANLFRNKWNQHMPESHIFHFSPNDFKRFFCKYDFSVVGEKYFYLETPYADIDKDLNLIKKAIELRTRGIEIDFESPPFWGNLMTLMFEKEKQSVK